MGRLYPECEFFSGLSAYPLFWDRNRAWAGGWPAVSPAITMSPFYVATCIFMAPRRMGSRACASTFEPRVMSDSPWSMLRRHGRPADCTFCTRFPGSGRFIIPPTASGRELPNRLRGVFTGIVLSTLFTSSI